METLRIDRLELLAGQIRAELGDMQKARAPYEAILKAQARGALVLKQAAEALEAEAAEAAKAPKAPKAEAGA